MDRLAQRQMDRLANIQTMPRQREREREREREIDRIVLIMICNGNNGIYG
jgi:hypothetical protein